MTTEKTLRPVSDMYNDRFTPDVLLIPVGTHLTNSSGYATKKFVLVVAVIQHTVSYSSTGNLHEDSGIPLMA